MARKPSNRGGTNLVLQYFIDHPNVEVSLSELSGATGLDNQHVRNAVRYLGQNKTDRLEEIHAGLAWKYSAGAKGKRLFEELATTKSGDILVQDESGTLYKLEEM